MDKKMNPYDYQKSKKLLRKVIKNFLILSGDSVGPSNKRWQDIAAETRRYLLLLAEQMDAAGKGIVTNGPICFPSPEDLE